jgi:hypothetical protein
MKRFGIFACAMLVIFAACKKGPGTGGRATLKGKVYAVNLANGLFTFKDSGYVADEKVYLCYGDENAIGDNQTTSFDGSFRFDYLRTGKYKVWVVSKKFLGVGQLDTIIKQEIEITSKTQELALPDFRIYTNKN